jgi:hypothetical protein
MRSGQIIQWQDLFVIVDDGTVPPTRYDMMERALQEQAKQCPSGIACMVVLPPGAKPPPDDIKHRVKNLLTRQAASLSCLAYVIEGTGFKGVAARATLIGMKVFASRPYPIYVEISMQDVLTKVLPHLTRGQTVTTDVNAIMRIIAEARAKWSASPPESNRVDGVISK